MDRDNLIIASVIKLQRRIRDVLPKIIFGRDRYCYRKMLDLCFRKKLVTFRDTGIPDASNATIGTGGFSTVYGNQTSDFSTTKFAYKVIPVSILRQDRQSGRSSLAVSIIEVKALKTLKTLAAKKKNGTKNHTTSFNRLIHAYLVKDRLPHFIHAAANTEKDWPYYLVLKLEHAGIPLLDLHSLTPNRIISIVTQLSLALQIAQTTFLFEHRDLKLNNVMVKTAKGVHETFIVNGNEVNVPNFGLKVVIIDFGHSRFTCDWTVYASCINVPKADYRFIAANGNWCSFSTKIDDIAVKIIADHLMLHRVKDSKDVVLGSKIANKMIDLTNYREYCTFYQFYFHVLSYNVNWRTQNECTLNRPCLCKNIRGF